MPIGKSRNSTDLKICIYICVFNSEWDRYREKDEGREWGEERERLTDSTLGLIISVKFMEIYKCSVYAR